MVKSVASTFSCHRSDMFIVHGRRLRIATCLLSALKTRLRRLTVISIRKLKK
jgi:hypothetical protein